MNNQKTEPPPRRRAWDPPTSPPPKSATPDETAARLARIEAIVSNLGQIVETVAHETSGLHSMVLRLARGEGVDEAPPTVVVERDKPWCCHNCGGRLGVYDPTEDVLRVRYREVYFWFHAGPGGYVETVCRSCCAKNRVDDQR